MTQNVASGFGSDWVRNTRYGDAWILDSMNDILEANDYHNLGLVRRSLRWAIHITVYMM